MSALTEPIEFDGDPTALYRLYASDGTLIYVGITASPAKRMAEHSQSSWWPEVTRKTMTWYDSRASACEAEEVAIATEDPRHNTRTDSSPSTGRQVGYSYNGKHSPEQLKADYDAGEWIEVVPGEHYARKRMPGDIGYSN